MSLKLGSNSINKAYLGTTEIQKMYLGSELVFDNSVPPVEPDDLFPGAVGFGAQWVFNRDYDVVVVANLNASGTGSFKEAVESTTTKPSKIVVFNGLSGIITTDSKITVQAGHQTYIAGQTSENGILLRGLSTFRGPLLTIGSGVDGAMVRGLGMAIGATGTLNTDGDSLELVGGQNIILDHCLMLWSTDENVGGWFNPTKVTIQNSIVAEALMNSTHEKGKHSMGVLFGDQATSMTSYKNIMATNNQRSPLINASSGGIFEVVSNVIWNHGDFGGSMQNSNYANFIGNLYNKDNGVQGSRQDIIVNTNTPSNALYVRDNTTTKRTSSDPQWDCVGGPDDFNAVAPTSYQSLTPFETPLKDEVTIEPSVLLAELTDLESGSGMFAKNTAETRVLGYVAAQAEGALIDDPSEVGGYPTIAAGTIITDSNGNGIPDDLEGTWGNDTFGYVNSLVSGASPPVEDYDYYVSNTGDDNADGQTPETAWQTVNKVNNFTFASGDTIGFNSGDTWLERLTVPASNLTIDKYGTGNDPIIEQVYIVDKDFVTVNNIHSTNTASSATAISVLGSNNIHLYRCTVRPNEVATDKVGILVRAAAPYDVPYHDVIIEECDIREFHSATGWSTGVAFNEYGENCQFINNTMYNNGEENVIMYVDNAYSSGWHDNYLISGNTIWNLDPTDDGATSFECGINFGWNCRNFTVENNYVYNVPRGIQFDSGTEDCIVKNNIIYNCKRGIHVLANDNGNATGSKIYNNTIHGTLISQEGIQLATGGSDDSPTITGFDIKNNIIIGGGGTELFIIKGVRSFPSTQVISFTSDNNMFYNNGDALRFYIEADPIYDLVGWQTAYSLDLNSTEQDPLLNIDSTLQSGSPALDAGETLIDVPLDYIGTSRPQGSAYSIGAYEEAHTAYGPELATNGNFDTDSDWTLEAGFTISGGKMNVVSGGNGYQGVNVDDSKTYRLTVTSDEAEGNIIVYADGMYWSELYYDGVNEYTLTIDTVGGSQTNQLRFGCTTNGTLDNVSLKEIL